MRLRVLAVALLSSAALPVAVVDPAGAAQVKPCGAVLVPARNWLQGQGVPVRSNAWGGPSCNGFSTRSPARQFGGGWQCVELAARLYHVRKWGRVFAAGNGGAMYIPEGSRGLQFHPNGSGYVPVPGDLVIEAHSHYGHVAVVDSVVNDEVHAVEQNASWSGRKTYRLEGSAASGAYGNGVVRGFMHSRRNTGFGTPGSAPVVLPPPPPEVAASSPGGGAGIAVRWDPPASQLARIREYEVQRHRWSPGGGYAGGWRTVAVEPESGEYVIGAAPGRTFKVRIRARNAVGWGAWSTAVPVTA